MGRRQIRLQAQGSLELGNGFRSLPLRKQHPAQQVVSLGAAGCELYDLFEGGAGVGQITGLHRRQSLAIK